LPNDQDINNAVLYFNEITSTKGKGDLQEALNIFLTYNSLNYEAHNICVLTLCLIESTTEDYANTYLSLLKNIYEVSLNKHDKTKETIEYVKSFGLLGIIEATSSPTSSRLLIPATFGLFLTTIYNNAYLTIIKT
jgi:hypothetical protein